jgi:hypothetical protein
MGEILVFYTPLTITSKCKNNNVRCKLFWFNIKSYDYFKRFLFIQLKKFEDIVTDSWLKVKLCQENRKERHSLYKIVSAE